MFGLPEISISTAGYQSQEQNTRSKIASIHALHARGIALDVSAPDIRPRNMTRSARRDLAASIRRNELELSGLDLWIPPEHFVNQATTQRAIESVGLAAEMSSELAALVGGRSRAIVSVVLPAGMPESDRLMIAAHAQRVGAIIADHQPIDPSIEHVVIPGIGVGIDPSMVMLEARSPGKAVTHAGSELASVRLNDMNAMGKCVVGSQGSKLDLKSYAGALIVAGQEWITLDVREMPDPSVAYQHASEAWTNAVAL